MNHPSCSGNQPAQLGISLQLLGGLDRWTDGRDQTHHIIKFGNVKPLAKNPSKYEFGGVVFIGMHHVVNIVGSCLKLHRGCLNDFPTD